jgi:hypothetical protein
MADIYAENKPLLPAAYVDFIETNDGWEGFLKDKDEYVVLWPKELIQENYDGYQMREYLDRRWFPIGSNGGGEMLCFDMLSRDGAVYWLPFIGMSDERPILRHESFSDIVGRLEGPLRNI